jgi:hypothetical protein
MNPLMAQMTINRDVPEESISSADDAMVQQPDPGVAAYRCKIYKALLQTASDSDYRKRPLVDRSAAWASPSGRR